MKGRPVKDGDLHVRVLKRYAIDASMKGREGQGQGLMKGRPIKGDDPGLTLRCFTSSLTPR